MIINVCYSQQKSYRKVKRESNTFFGIEDKKRNIFEYKGMLISYGKNAIQINTLLSENVDFCFLVELINSVFKNCVIGISGIPSDKQTMGFKDVNVFWI